MGIKLSTDFIDNWKHIINNVEKTDIPTHLIDKIIVQLVALDESGNQHQQVIDVSELKAEGFDTNDIENIINETLYELNDFIDAVDFFLDIEAVAQEVQPNTDKMLQSAFTKSTK